MCKAFKTCIIWPCQHRKQVTMLQSSCVAANALIQHFTKTLLKKVYINNKNTYNSTTKAFLYLFVLENTFKSCKSIVTGHVLIHTA